jgi:hypothetical protein
MTKKIHKKTGETCPICMEKIIGEGVTLHKTKRQTHRLCLDCCTGYLRPLVVDLTSNMRQNIRHKATIVRCTGTNHGALRNQCRCGIDIRNIAIPHGTPLATDIFRLTHALADPDIHICINPDCGELVEAVVGTQAIVCPSCSSRWCYHCLTQPYHDGMSCLEHEAIESSTETGKLILDKKRRGDLKFCPQCRVPTEKVRNSKGEFVGCNKIVCGNCRVRWCWLCQAVDVDYSHYNPASSSGCVNRLWEGVDTVS